MFWICLSAALAQSGLDVRRLNAQMFRPSIDGTTTLWTDDARRAPHRYATARAVVGYARDPFVFAYDDGTVVALLSDVVAIDLLGGVTLGPVRSGVRLPVYALAVGDLDGVGAGLGDMGLDLKGTLLDPEAFPLGIALSGRADFPTTTLRAPLGSHAFSWEGSLILEGDVGPVTLAMNGGYRGLPAAESDARALEWDDQLTLRFGTGVALGSHGVDAELAAHVPLSDPPLAPAEAMIGGWYRVREAIALRGAVGTGLTGGIGSPALRVLFGVSYEPPPTDLDGDGVGAKDDRCPREPEDLDEFQDADGCPESDNDRDGMADGDDTCPNQAEDFDGYRDGDGCEDPHTAMVKLVDVNGALVPGVTARVVALEPVIATAAAFGVHLPAGTYPIVAEAEGYIPVDDTIVIPGGVAVDVIKVMQTAHDSGELVLAVMNEDGIRLTSTWEIDGGEPLNIPGGELATRVRAGHHQVVVRAVGYAPLSFPIDIQPGASTSVPLTLRPPRVKLLEQKIEINGTIFFELASATIQEESFELLDEIAQTLLDYPQLKLVRIEGHTDARGSKLANLELSEARAKAVMTYIVSRGVDAPRLLAIGYGSLKPIMQGDTEEAYAFNRRVEFWVEERSELPPE